MTKTNYFLKKTTGIYCITHTESGKQYCGQSVDCFERWKQHSTPKKNSTGIKGALMKWGVDAFSFTILEECSKEELNEREVWWIAELGTLSPGGYNLNSGGGSPTYVSDETRAKIRVSHLGKTHSQETKDKMSASGKGKNTGKTASQETKDKMSALRKGVLHSPEHRAKISASNKGRIVSAETREKIGAAQIGKTLSEDHRLKLSASLKGNTRAAGNKGKKQSPEAVAAAVEGRRRGKAARAEAEAFAASLQKLTDSLRQDSTWIPMDAAAIPPAGPPSVVAPSLEELEFLCGLL